MLHPKSMSAWAVFYRLAFSEGLDCRHCCGGGSRRHEQAIEGKLGGAVGVSAEDRNESRRQAMLNDNSGWD